MNENDKVLIEIPSRIIDKIKEKIKNSEFKTIEEYIIFVLRNSLIDAGVKSTLDPDEEKQVKETLKKLGYL